MAKKASTNRVALERFGREVIVAARDSTIAWHDLRMEPDDEGLPDGSEWIRALPAETQAAIRKLVVSTADETLFYVLKKLDDLGTAGGKLIVDGIDILEPVRHLLHGQQLTESGWFARHSRYGEHGDFKRSRSRKRRPRSSGK